MTPEQAVEFGVLKTQVQTIKELLDLADREGEQYLDTGVLRTALDVAERTFKKKALDLATRLLNLS
jgi:hypothetical protein